MIITRVILQDYGVYQGKHEFDFDCKRDHPLILVGGTNGAGKTTLFESIMLGLYGISAKGKRTTRKAYEQFLARKIHRYLGSATSADFASITVQFKFFHDGKETEYKVERMWRNEGGSINEQLTIKKRHTQNDTFNNLDQVEKSYWQSFIEDLIPLGILKLFFFDGEKIVEIAKEGREDLTIQESFKSLLGLDIAEQLRTDLHVNLVRNLVGGKKTLQFDFEKLKEEKEESLKITSKLETRLAQKQTEMDTLQMEIENLEEKTSKIGGAFSKKRDDAKSTLAGKLVTRDTIKKQMQDMCSDVLPFSMIPKRLDELAEQITLDEKLQQEHIETNILKSKLHDIDSEIKHAKFWKDTGVSLKDSAKIRSKLSLFFESKLDSKDSNKKPVLGLSSKQIFQITEVMTKANHFAIKQFDIDAQKLIILDEEITSLQTSIASAPDDDEIGPLISKLSERNSYLGELKAEMDHIEEKISTNAAMRKHNDIKLREIVSQMYRDEKAKVRVELTQNVQDVLEEFIEKLKIKKLKLLEKYLLEGIHTLLHKQNFIEKITIDPNTFEVKLFRKNDDLFPKDMLSEGEKQMFATTILWALAKTSGRPLPFMIDTPLARLDEQHRTNIVEKFLPIASHQTLIFSTDKEIEFDYYAKLESYMTRSYVMEYDSVKGATQKHDGYFWNKKGVKIVAI